MSDHLVIRTSLAVASIHLLQVVMPAIVVTTTLFGLTLLLDVAFDEFYIGLGVIAATLATMILRPQRMGSLGLQRSAANLGAEIALGWGVVLAILLGLGFAIGASDHFARRVLLPWIILVPTLLLLVSLLLRRLMRSILMSQENLRSAIIAGVNEPGLQLAEKLNDHPELCLRLVGFFDDRSGERLGDRKGVPLLGKLSDLAAFAKNEGIDVIFIALPIRHVQRVMALLDELRDTTASIYFVPDIFMFDLIQSRTTDIHGMPVVAMCETPFYGYRGILKRVTDITLTLIALVPALPVMATLAALIKVTSKGPAIFRQTRYGLDGEEIVVYKFRSMFVTENGTHVVQAKKDDPRITPIGRLLRKYSLDELPQLFNVLQGRMSLVGPRPHAVAHNEQYRHLVKGYMMRHKVLPGITGLAQVSGCRGETADTSQMQARVEHDLNYLRHWTPIMDIKILVRTIALLLGDPRAY